MNEDRRQGGRRTGSGRRRDDQPAAAATGAVVPKHLAPPPVAEAVADRLRAADLGDPHAVLGAHPAALGENEGIVVRAYHPNAIACECLVHGGPTLPMEPQGGGLFAVFLAGWALPIRYRLRFHYIGGGVWERDDPYRFVPTLGDVDLHLFNEGTHRRLWEKLGAHERTIDGVEGVSFAVWAPNARRVSVVGEFCNWDARVFPMRLLGASGVFELFVPGLRAGTRYKYEIRTREGQPRLKTDPFAFEMEQPPGNASVVVQEGAYEWGDGQWMTRRPARDVTREPMTIYEVHLGSWARVPEEQNRPLTYREITPKLVEHVTRLGFTHVELLPISEHPFYGSWGYQVSGYFAPTSRYGSPDDFRFLVDSCHRAGIGVILDWVPAHFPKDDYALRRFDGTALYEHEDPRVGEHPDWGTLIFNYGRHEVRNFLIANALYWLEEFHIDGLRVDAVASMLYLDYSRRPGQWLRNRLGGRENLDAIEFLRRFNETIDAETPGCFTVAEESTAWPHVTRPAREGGLGFTFKWNMGWMHDTLKYLALDPLYRQFHQDQITFAMMYEYSERFIMPLSHDEVVHLKRSLFGKMPGDEWQKLATLRLLLTYQFTRPGKALVFMGTELAQRGEWNHDTSLDWHLLQEPLRASFLRFVETLGHLYRGSAPFWVRDYDPAGFEWIDVNDRENSVLSYVRCGELDADLAVVVLNFTPIARSNYRIGAPAAGAYRVVLNSDDDAFGGSGVGPAERIETEAAPFHGFEQSLQLLLPPLGALVLRLEPGDSAAQAVAAEVAAAAPARPV